MERWTRKAALGGAAILAVPSALSSGGAYAATAATGSAMGPTSDLSAQDCAADRRVVREAPMHNRNGSGHRQGMVYLLYSPSCRTVWAKVDTQAGPCVPGDDLCGKATLHRNSDNAELVCHIPRGATSCITGMLNDANVTSYAEGEFDYGPWGYYGKTASY